MRGQAVSPLWLLAHRRSGPLAFGPASPPTRSLQACQATYPLHWTVPPAGLPRAPAAIHPWMLPLLIGWMVAPVDPSLKQRG